MKIQSNRIAFLPLNPYLSLKNNPMTIQNLQFIVNVLNQAKVTGISESRELLQAAGACEVLASKLVESKMQNTSEVFDAFNAKLSENSKVSGDKSKKD